jgi:hypothetical protein
MDHSVALEVSLKEVSVCVLGADGTLTNEGHTASDPASLIGLIRAKAPWAVRIGLETGSAPSARRRRPALSRWVFLLLKGAETAHSGSRTFNDLAGSGSLVPGVETSFTCQT